MPRQQAGSPAPVVQLGSPPRRAIPLSSQPQHLHQRRLIADHLDPATLPPQHSFQHRLLRDHQLRLPGRGGPPRPDGLLGDGDRRAVVVEDPPQRDVQVRGDGLHPRILVPPEPLHQHLPGEMAVGVGRGGQQARHPTHRRQGVEDPRLGPPVQSFPPPDGGEFAVAVLGRDPGVEDPAGQRQVEAALETACRQGAGFRPAVLMSMSHECGQHLLQPREVLDGHVHITLGRVLEQQPGQIRRRHLLDPRRLRQRGLLPQPEPGRRLATPALAEPGGECRDLGIGVQTRRCHGIHQLGRRLIQPLQRAQHLPSHRLLPAAQHLRGQPLQVLRRGLAQGLGKQLLHHRRVQHRHHPDQQIGLLVEPWQQTEVLQPDHEVSLIGGSLSPEEGGDQGLQQGVVVGGFRRAQLIDQDLATVLVAGDPGAAEGLGCGAGG